MNRSAKFGMQTSSPFSRSTFSIAPIHPSHTSSSAPRFPQYTRLLSSSMQSESTVSVEKYLSLSALHSLILRPSAPWFTIGLHNLQFSSSFKTSFLKAYKSEGQTTSVIALPKTLLDVPTHSPAFRGVLKRLQPH